MIEEVEAVTMATDGGIQGAVRDTGADLVRGTVDHDQDRANVPNTTAVAVDVDGRRAVEADPTHDVVIMTRNPAVRVFDVRVVVRAADRRALAHAVDRDHAVLECTPQANSRKNAAYRKKMSRLRQRRVPQLTTTTITITTMTMINLSTTTLTKS